MTLNLIVDDDDENDDDGGNGLSHSQIVDPKMEVRKDDDMNQTGEGWRDRTMTDKVRWACKDAGRWAPVVSAVLLLRQWRLPVTSLVY